MTDRSESRVLNTIAKALSVAGLLVAVTLALVVAIAIYTGPPLVGSPSYSTTIAADVSPQLPPDRATSVVLNALRGNETRLGRTLAEPRILSVEAMKGSAVPQPNSESNLDSYPIVWIVKAEGTFVAFSARAGTEPLSADTGAYFLDDDGAIIGVELPLDQ